MYALFRAIQMAKTSKESSINIMSDSKSSLNMLRKPLVTHPLAIEMKKDLKILTEEGRKVRLFWLKAHVGTPGNERADELAKMAALATNTVSDYNKVPMSYIRRKIREKTTVKWQERYQCSSTGSVTKTFFPTVQKARDILRHVTLTPTHVQAMTGHGGFAAYLHRFHLKDSPSCICDPAKEETIFHLLIECPRFGSYRSDLEIQIEIELSQTTLPTIMEEKTTREPLMVFISKVVSSAAARNGSTLYTAHNNEVNSCSLRSRTSSRSHRLIQLTSNQTQHSRAQTPISLQSEDNSPTQPQSHTETQRDDSTTTLTQLNQTQTQKLLSHGQSGEPKIRLRPIPLFMSNPTETLGITYSRQITTKHVNISPGLATILNGSTSKTNMKMSKYLALPTSNFAGQPCRILQLGTKTLIVFEWDTQTAFERACSSLTELRQIGTSQNINPRIISVDAMSLGQDKGGAANYYGIVKASEHHEVIVYENRGDDLGFLKSNHDGQLTASQFPTEASSSSASERLQASRESQKEDAKERNKNKSKMSDTSMAKIKAFMGSIKKALHYERRPKPSISQDEPNREDLIESKKINSNQIIASSQTRRQASAIETFLKEPPPQKQTIKSKRYRADFGQVLPPKLRLAHNPEDHTINAFLEFQAIMKGNNTIKFLTCNNIMQAYQRKNQKLLNVRLEEAKAAIYDNATSTIIAGAMAGRYMAAFNADHGFVVLDEDQSKRTGTLKYITTTEEQIVVVAECTRVMLEDRIIERAEILFGDSESSMDWNFLTKPINYSWVNGVPGCGKTTWIINNFNEETDIIITTTIEAADDLRQRLSMRTGNKNKVRTMASLLVNGTKGTFNRLIVDEALMNHFGSIIMATQLTSASDVILIGDINQLPFIERENLFKVNYARPDLVTSITQELSCTHRSPMDVAYALSMVYKSIYSSKETVRSLKLMKFTGARIPKTDPYTLYLVFTQEEKAGLINTGYGTGTDSRVLTIHEAQGLTSPSVIIIQTKSQKLAIHDSVPHAVVAISRHTNTCVYYTDTDGDAVASFIKRATETSMANIKDQNIKMAIKDRNYVVLSHLIG